MWMTRAKTISQHLRGNLQPVTGSLSLWKSGSTLTSHSCLQVHRAVMQLKGKPRDVVVKVRHPGVAHSITVDFRLLKPVAAAASRIPSLKGLSLKESLAQFSANMTAQARTCLLLCHNQALLSGVGWGCPSHTLCACRCQQPCPAARLSSISRAPLRLRTG